MPFGFDRVKSDFMQESSSFLKSEKSKIIHQEKAAVPNRF